MRGLRCIDNEAERILGYEPLFLFLLGFCKHENVVCSA